MWPWRQHKVRLGGRGVQEILFGLEDRFQSPVHGGMCNCHRWGGEGCEGARTSPRLFGWSAARLSAATSRPWTTAAHTWRVALAL